MVVLLSQQPVRDGAIRDEAQTRLAGSGSTPAATPKSRLVDRVRGAFRARHSGTAARLTLGSGSKRDVTIHGQRGQEARHVLGAHLGSVAL